MSDSTSKQGNPSGADSIPAGSNPAGSIEETRTFRPRFGPDGLLAVAATDSISGRLLMVAWMNEEALRLSLRTGEAHYWSRSRQTIWRKGETSGHVQRLVEMRTDCDQDAIEIVVEQIGAACHTGRGSCFYRRVVADETGVELEFED